MGKVIFKSCLLVLPILYIIGCLRIFFGADEFLPSDLGYYWNIFLQLNWTKGALDTARYLLDWLKSCVDFSQYVGRDWLDILGNVIRNWATLILFGMPALLAIIVIVMFIPISFLAWFFGSMATLTDFFPPVEGSAIGNVLLSLPLTSPVGV